MRKIENKGVVSKIHSSGMVESDKGYKFPFSRANIGDIMIDVNGDRMIVTKEEYRANYTTKKPRVKKIEEENSDERE